MDGSEPGETLAAAVVSGAPIDLQARTVRYADYTDLISKSETMLIALSESTNQQSQQHNQALGMDYHGSWIGILLQRAIGGKIH
jgi:hypothetical protein